MITAYGREEVMRLAKDVEIDGFIIKPLSSSILLDTIMGVLGNEAVFSTLDDNLNDIDMPVVNNASVLLVDDNEDWREQLGGLLQDNGYEVIAVASKEEAIQHVTHEQYNLAIIDMRLDEEDEDNREGVALGYWLINHGHNLPIIIMSAYEMETEVVKNIALRPFQFSPVEKGNIGSGGVADLLRQVELALQ